MERLSLHLAVQRTKFSPYFRRICIKIFHLKICHQDIVTYIFFPWECFSQRSASLVFCTFHAPHFPPFCNFRAVFFPRRNGSTFYSHCPPEKKWPPFLYSSMLAVWKVDPTLYLTGLAVATFPEGIMCGLCWRGKDRPLLMPAIVPHSRHRDGWSVVGTGVGARITPVQPSVTEWLCRLFLESVNNWISYVIFRCSEMDWEM